MFELGDAPEVGGKPAVLLIQSFASNGQCHRCTAVTISAARMLCFCMLLPKWCPGNWATGSRESDQQKLCRLAVDGALDIGSVPTAIDSLRMVCPGPIN